MRAGRSRIQATTREMEAMGMSPMMGQLLAAVCESPPGPMRQLATRFGVDPAWITGVGDRLEARGDVVRRTSPYDRRVKILEATAAGRRTFEALQAFFSEPPPELLDVPREDLLALVRIAERLAAGSVSAGTTPPDDLPEDSGEGV